MKGRLSVVLYLVLIGSALSKPSSSLQKYKPHSFIWDEYQVVAFIGKGQIAQLLLDISSSETWAYSDDCKTCPATKGLSSNGQQNGDAFKLDFTEEDNEKSGSIEGEIVLEDLILSPENFENTVQKVGNVMVRGFVSQSAAKKHKFGLVTSVVGADETVDAYGQKLDGRIGLGLDENSKTSIVDLLFGNYDKLMCLIRGADTISSKLTLGQKMLDDTVKYTITTSSKVVDANEGKWVVSLSGYSFGKYSGSKTFRAQLSTTTSFIGVPAMLYKQIQQVLSAYESDGALLIRAVNKAKAPQFELKFGDKKLVLKPQDYISNDGPSSDEFFVKIRKTQAKNDFVLGTSFLDSLSFCLNFDTKTVNFLDVTAFKWQDE